MTVKSFKSYIFSITQRFLGFDLDFESLKKPNYNANLPYFVITLMDIIHFKLHSFTDWQTNYEKYFLFWKEIILKLELNFHNSKYFVDFK